MNYNHQKFLVFIFVLTYISQFADDLTFKIFIINNYYTFSSKVIE